MSQNSQPSQPFPQSRLPILLLIDGALDQPEAVLAALHESGWQVLRGVHAAWRTGSPVLAVVPWRVATRPEEFGSDWAIIAAVAPGDGAAGDAALRHGVAGVVSRSVDPGVVEAQFRLAWETAEGRAAASRASAQLALLASRSYGAFWELDVASGNVRCGIETSELLGLPAPQGDCPLEVWLRLFPSDSRDALRAWLSAIEVDSDATTFEHTLLDDSGQPRRVRHTALRVGHGARNTTIVFAESESGVARRTGAATAERLAEGRATDPTRFLHEADRAVREAGRSGKQVAVLYLDVRRARSLTAGNLSNDAAELLLAAVSARVRDGLQELEAADSARGRRASATLARWDGDHFTVLLPDLARVQDAARHASRIVELLSRPFEICGRELCVPASIGIAGFPDDHHAADELVRRAAAAADSARQEGHAALKFYSAALDARAFERLTLETSLRRALERNELRVYYQPRVDVRSETIVGFEALLRWKHPELGFISPAQFIPLAEETGLIVPIGDWVLREACRQAMAWQAAGIAPVRMAVNLSSVQFSQPNLHGLVHAALAETGLDPRWLELELTESTVMRDPGAVVRTLTGLKEAGIHLSIDDFGTGYSSLAYLKRFPIDALKIDQSFIRESTSNADDAAIVTSILLMARSLQLAVVAEGVETESQLSFLRVMQCDEVQGYLFSPPVPPEKAQLLLERGFGRRKAA